MYLGGGGGSAQHPVGRPWGSAQHPSRCRPPDADFSRMQTPPPPPYADTPVMRPVMHTGKQTPSPDRMTDACKNITLPQTSFAGGNNTFLNSNYQLMILTFSLILNVFFKVWVSSVSEIMPLSSASSSCCSTPSASSTSTAPSSSSNKALFKKALKSYWIESKGIKWESMRFVLCNLYLTFTGIRESTRFLTIVVFRTILRQALAT